MKTTKILLAIALVVVITGAILFNMYRASSNTLKKEDVHDGIQSFDISSSEIIKSNYLISYDDVNLSKYGKKNTETEYIKTEVKDCIQTLVDIEYTERTLPDGTIPLIILKLHDTSENATIELFFIGDVTELNSINKVYIRFTPEQDSTTYSLVYNITHETIVDLFNLFYSN